MSNEQKQSRRLRIKKKKLRKSDFEYNIISTVFYVFKRNYKMFNLKIIFSRECDSSRQMILQD